MEKRWNILPTDIVHERALHAVLKINPALCRMLVQRGYTTFERAKHFFRPELSMLYNPWLMRNMDKAVARIQQAFQHNEKILVYGDYDVDGTTAVACLYSFLKELHSNIDFYIPHRYKEGYGISKTGVDFAKENNFTLVISLDCGIKAVGIIDYANTLGIDFIVCDHHLPDAEVPNAVAVLDPKQKDCLYPYKELCGCGVGFKLMQALADKLHLPEKSYLQYIDLVATAIAADIVSITDENRVLAFYGLKKVNENPSIGIKALLELAQVKNGNIKITDLVFIIAPRVNAAGRMDDARKAVQLFIEKNYEKALAFAEQLHTDNSDRKEADASITEEALEILQQDPNAAQKKTTVLFRNHWHKGVVGIVASRLIDTFYRPTVILTQTENVVSGSARSVPGFNLYEAVHACREYLLGYGGHFAAAGMTLLPENVTRFADKFEEVVSETISPELLIPEIIIDAEIKFSDITFSFYNIIRQMEPFGPDNMTPVFISRNVENTGLSKVVKEKHIRFALKQGKAQFTGIGFNLADKFDILVTHKNIDIVYKIEENEFMGIKSLQLKIVDFSASEQ